MKKIIPVLISASVVVLLITFTLIFRQNKAIQEIELEWNANPEIIPELKSTSRLEIIPLYEEASLKDEFIEGHGVSYLLRTDSSVILLDVGNNPDNLETSPLIHNMELMGIDSKDIYRIVISHPHPDHIGGIKAWWLNSVSLGNSKTNEADPLIFVPTDINVKGAIHATIPTLPGIDIATTGVISYLEPFPFSLKNPKGGEQALVVNIANEGLVLITGCGHPGIEKLITRSETLFGLPVFGIVGGLHNEKENNEQVKEQIQFLQSRPIELIAISPHDSNSDALAAFQEVFAERYQTIKVGESIIFPKEIGLASDINN
ncbi:MAG TPA: MBL fold metallo-hydrolase [Anaerolineaceae bacterium]|nr:MBL fold metallo-hydrolase [Anaerolineaceae bacterium]